MLNEQANSSNDFRCRGQTGHVPCPFPRLLWLPQGSFLQPHAQPDGANRCQHPPGSQGCLHQGTRWNRAHATDQAAPSNPLQTSCKCELVNLEQSLLGARGRRSRAQKQVCKNDGSLSLSVSLSVLSLSPSLYHTHTHTSQMICFLLPKR